MSNYLDKDFWHSRDLFAWLQEYAQARRISPNALLYAFLTRFSTLIPPHVVADALVGSTYVPYGLFLAIVAESGRGKGLATGGATALLPDLCGASTTQPASGEGIVSLFAGRRSVPDPDGKPTKETEAYCITPRALLNVPEISSLGAKAGRTGNTIVPTLTSAFSGEDLGGNAVVEQARKLQAPRYGYSLALISGVQPASSSALLDEQGVGLPQRFLWTNCLDPNAPKTRPDEPFRPMPLDLEKIPTDHSALELNALYQAGSIDRVTRMEDDSNPYRLTIIGYPGEAAKEIDRLGYQNLHGERIDPLNSHNSLVKTKLAGILALTESRLEVTMEDWQTAGVLLDESQHIREQTIQQAREIKTNDVADYLSLKDDAAERVKTQKMTAVKNQVIAFLQKHDPSHEGRKGWEIRQTCGRNGPLAYEAIDALADAGKLDRIGEQTDKASSQLWALPIDT